MNADEIVKALRWLAKDTEFIFAAENLNDAADLIESLQAQLAAVQHQALALPDYAIPQAREFFAQRLKSGTMLHCERPSIHTALAAFDALSASQRREQAAVEDLIECMTEYAYTCKFCRKWNGRDVCPSCKPEWRGPQEAGEGVTENG